MARGADYGGAIAEMNQILGVDAADELPDRWGGDKPLAALERATLQQALTTYDSSARDLSAAEQQLELLDLSTDPIGTLGSYLYSDSVKTYRTPPTERLALNAINLLNYLARNDLDGAAVEARRFQVMRDYLASVRIEADAPATLGAYLAGFVFEHRGEGDRALRYYEEALSRGPLGTLDDPIRRLARHNPYRGPNLGAVLARQGRAGSDPGAASEVLVVVSLGRVPQREPRRIPIGAAVGLAGIYATGNVDWLKYGATKVVVYPDLVTVPSGLGQASVRIDGEVVPVEPLTDFDAAVRREYEAAKPQIIAAALTRMATRAALAEGVRAAGKTESDELGTVLSLLFESAMVAFDRPDTRSWTMLPGRVLVARIRVPPGSHTVEVDIEGGGQRRAVVEVPPTGYAAVVVTEPR